MRQLEGLSVVSLRISSTGFDSIVNEALKLPALSENLFHKLTAEDLLDKLYALLTPEINRGNLNEAKVITRIADWRMLLFRTMTDGQDRQYLEFYGRREQVEPTIVRFLLPRLKENFYFRGEQSRMQDR